jgi:hypothetical protein
MKKKKNKNVPQLDGTKLLERKKKKKIGES